MSELAPDLTALFNRAVRLHRAGSVEEAASLYREVLRGAPEHADVLGNLGSILSSQGEYDEAIACINRAITLAPTEPGHPYNLGNAYRSQGELDAAVVAYHQALSIAPRFAMAHYNLGLAYKHQNRRPEAEAAYRSAIAADPTLYDAHLNLGGLLLLEGVLTEATACFEAARALDPQRAAALNNLAQVQAASGRFDDSLRASRAALKLEPDNHSIASNILFTLQYVPGHTDAELLATARSFGARFPAVPALPRPPLAGRRLRIGYVSGDFYNHTVGLLLRGILPTHDPARVEVFCYHNSRRADDVTAALAACCQWRTIVGVPDEAVLTQIREDAIDVLVDLSGHTAGNRLPLFARRAAPLQISWLGYFATTGLPAMDAVLMDEHHVPPGSEGFFSEQVWRLPHTRFTYAPVPFAPAVLPPASALTKGTITFGSFNNSAKINPPVIAAWSEILRQVLASRLLLKWRSFNDPVTCRYFLDQFAAQGIAPDRIELRRHTPHVNLLQEYGDVDIGLDPFPFTGGHTSLEALWMGVPVVTLAGSRPVSRQTYCFLSNIGLAAELAASDETDYIAKAVALARTPARLAALRDSLRDRMRASPLMDGQAMARHLEDAYVALWYGANDRVIATLPVANWFNQQALAAWNSGDFDRARDLMRAAISADPKVANYHASLAMMLKDTAPPEARAQHYRRALELDPTAAVLYGNLAAVLNQMKDHTGAEAAARAGLALSPDRPETWHNLGSALIGQARWEAAALAFDTALQHQPGMVLTLQAAAQAYRAAGQPMKAVERYRGAQALLASQPLEQRAIPLGPVWRALGEVLAECLNHGSSEQCFREALVFAPDDLALLTNLGNALTAQGKFDEAGECYHKVAARAPHLPGAQINLGTLFQTLGRHAEALTHYRAALALSTNSPALFGNLGTSLTYSASHGPADLKATYDEFDRLVARPLRDPRPHANDRNPDRPLRVGYVSPDFRRHAVAYFALPLLQGHREHEVQVVCYYNHRQDDEWTRRFRASASEWVDCVAMDDAVLAERIRQDRIDILVDLAGHTEGGRLLTFARKPAPLQVTWMGYVTTTGLSAMDYRLTHADADPPGVEADYAETLVRLPGTLWCYRPLPGMPEVASPPFQRNGHITFGSFNRFSKVSMRVLDCWAELLGSLPASRLILCIPEGRVREDVMARFAVSGVQMDRLSFFSKVSHQEFWALHGEVDIALDPFPFNGGATTCETLWLGVPLVTCTGGPGAFAPRFASRLGRTFLNAVGLPELVAADEKTYVETAVALARDPDRLARLRRGLRDRMAASPLTDEPRFVREVEAAYREMWRRWCAGPVWG